MTNLTIERFIVTHRCGCELYTPLIFNTYPEACNYMETQLASHISDYIQSNYVRSDPEYFLVQDNDAAALIDWAEENDLLCGDNCFTGNSDWEEYEIDSIQIELTAKEIAQILENEKESDEMER